MTFKLLSNYLINTCKYQ